MRARIGSLFLVAALAIPAAACGSGSSGKAASASTPTTVDPALFVDKTAEKTVTITATDDLFTPQYTKVRAGTTVVFANGGRNQHDLISADGAFKNIDTDAFAPGVKVNDVVTALGNHAFYCSLHGTETTAMHGALLVVP